MIEHNKTVSMRVGEDMIEWIGIQIHVIESNIIEQNIIKI